MWDDPADPENYLELIYSPESTETAAARISESLSQEYELYEGLRELDRAGSCVYIEASVIKNTNYMADRLQAVYIIPAADGCRIATAHCYTVESEGFLRRFQYMLHTLAVLER